MSEHPMLGKIFLSSLSFLSQMSQSSMSVVFEAHKMLLFKWSILVHRVQFCAWSWPCTAVLFTLTLSCQYTLVFPGARKIFRFTAARHCYDSQNILSSRIGPEWICPPDTNPSVVQGNVPSGAGGRTCLAAEQCTERKWFHRHFHLPFQNPPGSLNIFSSLSAEQWTNKARSSCTPWK